MPHSRGTASDILEEGGDDVKSAWPLWAGPHTCYNGNYNGKQGCKAERIRKDCLSSDCSLQLGNMKLESLVIADQHAAVNMYPGPVHTARHTLGIGFARSIGPMITHDFCVPLVPQRLLVVFLAHTTVGSSTGHFVPSCSSIGNQDKPGTTVRRENTRSHSDLDMWNRLAPYVLKLFGRHGIEGDQPGRIGRQVCNGSKLASKPLRMDPLAISLPLSDWQPSRCHTDALLPPKAFLPHVPYVQKVPSHVRWQQKEKRDTVLLVLTGKEWPASQSPYSIERIPSPIIPPNEQRELRIRLKTEQQTLFLGKKGPDKQE
ncbi:hypothetical protein RIF29_47174 [Crotalaria pallida]|uniref:Uncharacterized protein n=1 Tax=Crotalaria pallida TaxID=3830 RepID=A0AAN9DQX9_CROPI